jgi:hypothetical protein
MRKDQETLGKQTGGSPKNGGRIGGVGVNIQNVWFVFTNMYE